MGESTDFEKGYIKQNIKHKKSSIAILLVNKIDSKGKKHF